MEGSNGAGVYVDGVSEESVLDGLGEEAGDGVEDLRPVNASQIDIVGGESYKIRTNQTAMVLKVEVYITRQGVNGADSVLTDILIAS